MSTPTPRFLLSVVLLGSVVLPIYATTRYVNVNGGDPRPPYTNWATAAREIQDAVDAASAGDEIVVTNGIYQVGGRVAPPYYLTNRVVIDKPVTVRSVNGPEATVIQGQGPAGTGAVRCAFLTSGATLVGFTLTNGATRTQSYYLVDLGGGGVWCESTNAIIFNCLIVGNSAADSGGGGAYSGTLGDCTLSGNSAYDKGGGARYSTLNRCTLTSNSVSLYGGGVSSGLMSNCVLRGNSALYGGGSHSCTLNNSALNDNAATYGGGAIYCVLNNCSLAGNFGLGGGGSYGSELNNCTVTGNSASSSGGGTMGGSAHNCIVYYNSAPTASNYAGGTFDYCCTLPLPVDGTANIAAEPELAGESHLSTGSPCWRAGSQAYARGADTDGELWATPPSIGCDEVYLDDITGPLNVSIIASRTNVATGFDVQFKAIIDGCTADSRWDFGDGTIVSNRPYLTHRWTAPQDYTVSLTAYNESQPRGVTAMVTVHTVLAIHHVAVNSTNPVSPYSDWATAATSIQQAVDVAAVPGALVLVSNGVYSTGGRAIYGSMTNRVAVTKPVIVQSVNGPEWTWIQGSSAPDTTNGNGAVRCVYLTNEAMLIGFTLTNGATRGHAGGEDLRERSGGGVWCESESAGVSNCVLTGNAAYKWGGGAFRGRLQDCSFLGNTAERGGGANNAALENCTLTGNVGNYGGGACSNRLKNCTLRSNRANGGHGGGADACSLLNCTLTGNSAGTGGGASLGNGNVCDNCLILSNSASAGGGIYAYFGVLNSCLLVGNTAGEGGGVYGYYGKLYNCTLAANSAGRGAGARSCTLNNCILYDNTEFPDLNTYGCTLNYCCTPGDGGGGTITNAPLFVDKANGDFRLQSNSPCINAGINKYASGSTDLDSHQRIVGGTVDIGAYEFQSPASTLSYAWLQQFGLPTDGSVDFVDTDGDGHNNWQEWRTDTVPTNALSRLVLLSPAYSSNGVSICWQSVSTRSYFIERGTNLIETPVLRTLATNIPGQTGTVIFTDTTATNPCSFIYRVGAQMP